MGKSFESLPDAVQSTAREHAGMVEAALPGRLAGYYLVGSAALGDFIPGKSDADFIAVLRGEVASEGAEALSRVHRVLRTRRSLAGLDGWYVPLEGFSGAAMSARFNEGRLLGLAPFNANTPDGWVLKRYGIRVSGEEPERLPYTVDWDKLCEGMARNLDSYWRSWVADCGRPWNKRAIGLYLNPTLTEWGVLGISRLYYSFRERDVASKTAAGEYALAELPERWHGIVREALRIRQGSDVKAYKSTVTRRNDVLDYMEYMIRETKRQ